MLSGFKPFLTGYGVSRLQVSSNWRKLSGPCLVGAIDASAIGCSQSSPPFFRHWSIGHSGPRTILSWHLPLWFQSLSATPSLGLEVCGLHRHPSFLLGSQRLWSEPLLPLGCCAPGCPGFRVRLVPAFSYRLTASLSLIRFKK